MGDHLQAKLLTPGIALNRILDNPSFGEVAANIEASGNKQHIVAKGNISRFDSNKYSFRNIKIDGSYTPAGIKGLASINDPNMRVNVYGDYAFAS